MLYKFQTRTPKYTTNTHASHWSTTTNVYRPPCAKISAGPLSITLPPHIQFTNIENVLKRLKNNNIPQHARVLYTNKSTQTITKALNMEVCLTSSPSIGQRGAKYSNARYGSKCTSIHFDDKLCKEHRSETHTCVDQPIISTNLSR